MARKLSRIARCDVLILATALAALPAPAAAEQRGRESAASQVVDNPFAERRPAPRAEAASPAAAQRPRTQRNPFAARRLPEQQPTTPQRRIAADYWRQPSRPASPAPPQTIPTDRPAAASWDLLSPTALRHTAPASFAAELELPPAGSADFPDPRQFAPHLLQQPTWLLPDEAKIGAHDDASADADNRPARSTAELFDLPEGNRPAPVDPPAASTPAGEPIDPFEIEPIEISDQDAASTSAAQAVAESLAAAHRPPADHHDASPAPTVAPAGMPPAARPAPPSAKALYITAQQAAESARSDEDLHHVLQTCRRALDQQPRAELARSLRSLAAWAHNRRGERLCTIGDEPAALSEFNAAIELDADCWLALHNRAISLAQQGRAEEALDDFRRVVELNPGLAIAHRNRGELLTSLGRTEQAIAAYGQAIDQRPDDPLLLDMRGHALHRLGRYQQALDDFNRSIELDARNATTYTHRANVHAELGEFDLALDDLRQALAIDVEDHSAYRSMAWLLATCPEEKFRDPSQALAAAERAARLAPPGDPFVLDALAAAYAAARQYEQAIRYQREAIALAPDQFAAQFSQRLSLYRQDRPYFNGEPDSEATAGPHRDNRLRAASHESTDTGPPIEFAP